MSDVAFTLDTTRAPWTDEQVANLAARQMAPLHPYTCVTHTSCKLLPTRNGWACPCEGCTYRQDWAYEADTRVRWWDPA